MQAPELCISFADAAAGGDNAKEQPKKFDTKPVPESKKRKIGAYGRVWWS